MVKSIRFVLCMLMMIAVAIVTRFDTTLAQDKFGKALFFDGSDQVIIPDAAELNFNAATPFTIEFWFKPAGPQYLYHLMGKRGSCWTHAGPETAYQFAWDQSGVGAGSSNTCGTTFICNPQIGQWSHIAWVYTGTQSVLYFNGVNTGTATCSIEGATSVPLKIGASDDCGYRFWGAIDEVRIWSVARSSADIVASMADTVLSNSDNLIAYWRFDSSAIPQLVYDYTEHGHNGSLGTDLGTNEDDPTPQPSDIPLGCCRGLTGNIDGDACDNIDISDLSALIDFLYISFQPISCPSEANCDGDVNGGIDISDLTALIDFLYISFAPPALCQ